MKTNELTSTALDWAVAKCLKLNVSFDSWGVCYVGEVLRDRPALFEPSADWAQAGPIIEREKLNVVYKARGEWYAYTYEMAHRQAAEYGPTPLIAAMRCLVASKLGDTIDIPEELPYFWRIL